MYDLQMKYVKMQNHNFLDLIQISEEHKSQAIIYGKIWVIQQKQE
jgi:hypothetical protein